MFAMQDTSLRTPIIAPSLLSCDFSRIGEEIRAIEDEGADWLHVDVMDGHFVPNMTFGPPIVSAMKSVATKPLDVHLMVSNPVAYAANYVEAGAEVLTYHWEAVGGGTVKGARLTNKAFRDAGAPKVGVSINPNTPVEPLEAILGEVDLVLIMSVFPGFGGQKFMEQAGADAFVAGSAIFGSSDRRATIASFRASAIAAMKAAAGDHSNDHNRESTTGSGTVR